LAPPELSVHRRRLLLVYGLLAAAYSFGLLFLLARGALTFLVTRAHDWGMLLFLALAAALGGRPLLQQLRTFASATRVSVDSLRESAKEAKARKEEEDREQAPASSPHPSFPRPFSRFRFFRAFASKIGK